MRKKKYVDLLQWKKPSEFDGKNSKMKKVEKLKGSFFNFPSITFASFCVNAQNQFHCTCQTFRLTTNKNEWEMHKKIR